MGGVNGLPIRLQLSTVQNSKQVVKRIQSYFLNVYRKQLGNLSKGSQHFYVLSNRGGVRGEGGGL